MTLRRGLTPDLLARSKAIAQVVMALGEVERKTIHKSGRPESDTTHTVMVCLLSYDIAEALALNPFKAAMYALVHDLVEAYAGDTNTARALSPEDQEAKDRREAEALERLKVELKGSPWIIYYIEEYEKKTDCEAAVVYYMDKIAPKLTHSFTRCAALVAMNMPLEESMAAHKKQASKLKAMFPSEFRLESLFLAACVEAEESYREYLLSLEP